MIFTFSSFLICLPQYTSRMVAVSIFDRFLGPYTLIDRLRSSVSKCLILYA